MSRVIEVTRSRTKCGPGPIGRENLMNYHGKCVGAGLWPDSSRQAGPSRSHKLLQCDFCRTAGPAGEERWPHLLEQAHTEHSLYAHSLARAVAYEEIARICQH